jgi:hypothetical protein
MGETTQHHDLVYMTDNPIVQSLLTKSREAEIPEELHIKRDEFEAIYKALPDIAQELVAAYKEILGAYKLNPGEVKLYMVGGRVKGAPLKETSDIDLIFSVQDKNQAPVGVIPGGNWDTFEGLEYRSIIKQSIQDRLQTICDRKNVVNRFHIIEYGVQPAEHEIDPITTLFLAQAA